MAKEDTSSYKVRLRSYSNEHSSKGSPLLTTPSKDKKKSVTPQASSKKKEKEKLSAMGDDKGTENVGQLLRDLQASVNEIKTDVADLKRSKCDHDISKKALDTLVKSDTESSTKIKLLSAIVIRQDARIMQLESALEAIQRNFRRPNLFIDGLTERHGDVLKDRIEQVQEFFKEKMEIQEEIKVKKAFWIGSSKNRLMKVELVNSDDKGLIFAHASNLKGKRNARRRLYFINDDLSEAEREQRNYFKQLKKDNDARDEDSTLKISLKKGKLTINNEVMKPKLSIPVPADVLTLEMDELEEIHQICTSEAGQHEEGGSEFLGYYQRVKSVSDVQKGLNKIKIKHGDASHIVTAYNLPNAETPFNQGFEDDGENGTGWRMLDELKQKEQDRIAVFVARYSDGSKLGPRKFDIYRDLTKKAIKKMRIKVDKLNRSSQLQRSHSQISQSSLASMASMDSLVDEVTVTVADNSQEESVNVQG